jgi:RNA polymerase primary sigma factor
MGTVPLLTREGEVAIAKRIEQGKLAVIKSISRTPKVTQEVLEMGEQLKRGERTVRELVVFNEEEITDEKIAARQRELVRQLIASSLRSTPSGSSRTSTSTSRRRTSASYGARSGASAARAWSSRA